MVVVGSEIQRFPSTCMDPTMIIECALWIAAILSIVFESSRYNIPKKCATYFVKYVTSMSRPALKNVTSYVSVTLGWAYDVFVIAVILINLDCATIQSNCAHNYPPPILFASRDYCNTRVQRVPTLETKLYKLSHTVIT